MGALRKVFGDWWVLSALAALFAVLVFVVLLPMVAAPLRPLWVRLVFLLLIALVWGGLALWRVLSARAASAKLADGLAAEAAAPGEDAEVAKRMQAALAGLKSVSGSRRDYLYSRPWYVIIGPPGAGKTTVLVNSGLRFPFSDTALKGVGGTRNLDFWFADEAVLVDTAGRYTTQDSDADRDKGAWTAFLQLLRKNRPLQPVNGVIVAIGLDELIGADVAKIDRHAGTVRRRLAELQAGLEASVPVYVVFTKADLLAGFNEFYDDLDVEGRRAVVGTTFPVAADPRRTPAEVAAAFDAVAQAAADRESKRLQDELDARRRSVILGFPSQLAGLRSRVTRFIDGAFPSNAPEAPAPLRGFYFTSGVQQGAPVDRLLGGLAQIYDAPAAAPAGGGQGRAYFLNRLLTEVVIPEAGLVASSPQARARRLAQVTGGLIAVGVAALLVLVAWIVSFTANRGFQGKLLAGAQNASQQVRADGIDLTEVRENDPDLEASLSTLRALRDLPRGYAEQHKGGPPLTMRFGLYQDSDARAASRAYLDTLQRVMLPRILLRLERYLNDHRAEPLALYEPLKVYLMLGGQAPKLDPKAVKSWVENDWATGVYPGEDRADTRRELGAHLDALLDDPQFGAVWPDRRAPLDGALITATRAQVQTLSLADRAYAVLRQRAAVSGGADWHAASVLSSGDAKAFANGAQVLGATISYFYTKPGFEKAYQGGLRDVQGDLEKDLWVLGGDQNTASIHAQMSSVRPGVAALYARDYIKAWQDFVAGLRPADVFTDPAAFGAATGSPPPLKTVLQQVVANTTFGGASAEDRAEAQARGAVLGKAGALGKLAGPAGAPIGQDAARTISDAFAQIKQFAGTGAAPAPVDEFIAKLKAAVTAKGSADRAASLGGGAGDAAQADLAKAMSELAAASATAPAMVQAVTSGASKAGDQAQVSSATGAVSTIYDQQVAPQCRSVTEQRYPFVTASKNDASLGDLQRLFGMNGAIDQFTQTKVRALLDTSGPVWRWKSGDPVAAALDPTSADEFRKAQGVRDLLVSGVPLKVESAGFGGAVTAAEIAFGGQTQRFDANQAGQRTMQWTANGLPEAKVTLYAGTTKLKEITADGPWALFRLMNGAKKENAGPQAIKATFGDGAATATFKLTLPSPENPFSRGGPWSFRCPPKL